MFYGKGGLWTLPKSNMESLKSLLNDVSYSSMHPTRLLRAQRVLRASHAIRVPHTMMYDLHAQCTLRTLHAFSTYFVRVAGRI